MKILLIAQFGLFGGTREAVKRILDVHQSKGYKTHVVIDHGSDNQIKEIITAKGATFTEMNRRGKIFNTMVASPLFEHLSYSSLLKEWKPDLVVASVGTFKHAMYPFLRNYPLVYILHSIPGEMSTHIRYFYKFFSLTAGKNQWVCGVSDATVDSVVRNWKYDRKQTAVLHNTFRRENVNTIPVKGNNSQIIVLTLGHVVSYKNPIVWLNVARQMTTKYGNVKFIWLGDGRQFQEFQDKTKDEPQIEFLGFREDVKKYYSKASVYFQPSILENHSFSVLDAMANGLPCVVSNVGGQPESIQDGINGYLCEPDDEESFVERLSQLIENPGLQREMGEQATRIVQKNFHPDHYEEKLISLYKKALKG